MAGPVQDAGQAGQGAAMKFSADEIARAAKCSNSKVRRVAREAKVKGEPDGRSHQLRFGREIARAFPKEGQRKAVARLFTSSVAVAGFPSGQTDSPDRESKPGEGATPTPTHSPAGAATDSKRTINELKPWARKRAVARGEILAHLLEYNGSREEFAAAYNRSEIGISEDTSLIVKRVCARTLKRWQFLFETGGLANLAGKDGEIFAATRRDECSGALSC
jgi:hypothetical protein